jgi:hypothetical protein
VHDETEKGSIVELIWLESTQMIEVWLRRAYFAAANGATHEQQPDDNTNRTHFPAISFYTA